jgi:hypothetical protein
MNKTAIVVVTCERFKQVWDPFFILFNRYWVDCPFKIYMITDFGNYNGVENITIGKDLGFSNNLIYGLSKIEEKNIIYFQEDYLAYKKFDTKKICDFIEHLVKYNISCLRLAPCPGPTAPWQYSDDLGVLQPGDNYRISTQTAIWKKEFLIKILKTGETGGDFEIQGTKRSNFMSDVLLSVWRDQTPTPYIITAVVRGVWQNDALELLKKEKISMKDITRVIK